MASNKAWKRRSFLQTAVGVPTLSLLPVSAAAAATAAAAKAAISQKFVPVDLSGHFNASPTDFGPHRPHPNAVWTPKLARYSVLDGRRRGIPR